ncbi:hypothetical protein NDU88_005885 [Pleurodeles waltl]|uniref:Arginine vasotocin receptor n=1 Tax=Pleurodeles waltl TaxID=8319 RepID=A0AAV7LDZ5_PLEWA|nr:hypothetical protein NDU88_005885 [Pleurodeles waltl]
MSGSRLSPREMRAAGLGRVSHPRISLSLALGCLRGDESSGAGQGQSHARISQSLALGCLRGDESSGAGAESVTPSDQPYV